MANLLQRFVIRGWVHSGFASNFFSSTPNYISLNNFTCLSAYSFENEKQLFPHRAVGMQANIEKRSYEPW